VLGTGVENLTLSGSGNLNGTGNSADNIITGNSGNNVLTGLLGSDTFVFLPGSFGNDTISDFTVGQDKVQFDHSTFATTSEIFNHASDDANGNVVISAGADSVTIQKVALAVLMQHPLDFYVV